MISDRLNCVFIHVPKCGGTSIENALWRPEEKTAANLFGGMLDTYHNAYQTGGLQHLTALQIRHFMGRKKFEACYKFSIVRNPFARAVSQFHHIQDLKFLRKYIGLSPKDDFKTYLRKIHKRHYIQWEPQVSFVYDHQGRQMVDYVGRFEELQSAFQHICSELNLEAELPHKKKSEHKSVPYQSYYDEESIAYIEDVFADDLEVFGYRFEPLS